MDSAGESLTKFEILGKKANDEIATLVRETCDKERWGDERFEDLLVARNSALHRVLGEGDRLVISMEHVVPAFWDTLHTLYTAYDIAKTTLEFCSYLVKQGKNVHERQKEEITGIAGSAEGLLTTVLDKARAVKKGLDEGGWIDRILEGGLPDGGEAYVTAEAVRVLVDENFLEEWAGLMVESWGDSVVGLGLLKPIERRP